MKISVLAESGDNRVALVPKVAEKLSKLGVEISLESGAGDSAGLADSSYGDAVSIATRSACLSGQDMVISIHPLSDEEMDQVDNGTVMISEFKPFFDKEVAAKIKGKGLQAISMDMIPRTTLAQSMDVLSSMASIAGYRAALLGASHLTRYFPMMITAAGSIKPGKVLVLGAGVAGLQAIATAKRLGAQVEAFDTRSAAKQEVESLGARFVEVEGAKEDTGAGGYAVEQDEDFIKRQREEVQNRAMGADVIITTAQVRGRKAPILVPASTVEKMKPGSVIIDLAASTGGNCELTEDASTVVKHGVTIIGDSNLAAGMPEDASTLYANNLFNFLKLIVKEGALDLNFEDEIVQSAYITH
ncbi:MAG: NAD(P) transhydrogenase subunit alpha [Saprospiraceae bacterium]|nr:NAD(P) transhydrogenase subunit alpha [Saprospiraceae bacterium]